MKTYEKWKKHIVNAKDYPVKSGDLIGELIVTITLSIFFGCAIMLISYEKELAQGLIQILAITVFLVVIIAIVISNAYVCIYKPMKVYETKYGATGLGQEWLKRKEK